MHRVEINPLLSDKVSLCHCVPSAVCLSLILIVLISFEYIYNIGYISIIILTAIVIESGKLLVFELPLHKLIWHEDKRASYKISTTKNLLYCFLELSISTLIYFITCILFGAEVMIKHKETFSLSVILSLLTVFPACIYLGPVTTLNLFCGVKPNEGLPLIIYYNLQATLLGAWLGAFLIPLDWDRQWQEWPIPCVLGAIITSVLFNTFYAANIFLQKWKSVQRTSGKFA